MKIENKLFKIFCRIKKNKIYFFVFIISFFIFGFNVGQASAAITYVGGASATGNSANFNVSLTGLTGGSGSAAIAGDMVIVIDGFVSTSNLDPGVSTAGYTEVADLYASDSDDANLSANWKIMGSTPDTLVTCLGSTVATNGAACVVQVWRGVDQSTPLDVTTTTAIPGNNIGSSVPNSPAITPVTSGAIVLAVGVGADAAADTAVTAPTGFGNQVHASVDITLAVRTSIASKAWSGSGAEDPAVWTGVTTSTAGSWVAATLALRPILNSSPIVTTPTETSITTTTATLGANVTSLGVPASISARGTCWGTSPAPTTNCLAEGGTTTGVFTHQRTGLSLGTFYYFRGYATNTTGTAYSSDGSFTTLSDIPTAPTFTDSDGTNQIAFNNISQNSTAPTFRVSATNIIDFNRFQLELNTVSNFTGTAYNQTFSGTYASGVPYNLTASGLSPSLPTTNGATYFVRARASADGGTNYSAWTTITKTFTYKSSGNPTWFQTTDEQFNTGTANGVIISSNSVQLGASGSWYNTGWNYRKKISIDHTKVGSGSLTDFPVLFSKTDTDLISKARADGFDILFTSSDGTTKLSHEIEKYSSSTGELITWIKIPSISSSVNTDIYIYYGNGTASNQQNITGTWDLNYTGIWHLNNIFSDATSNANNGTNTGTTDVVGKIANGRGYVRSDGADFITVTGLMDSPANVTLSGWGTLTSRDTNGAHLISIGDYLAINVDDVTDGYLGSFYDAGWGLTKSSPKLNPAGSGWHYFVYTFDDTSNAQFLYMDGVLVGSGTFANPIMYSGQGSNTVIGSHANGNANFDFDGSIDEVRVSNSVRSTGWVQAEYANQSSPSTFYNVGSEETSANDNGSITSPAINFNLVPGSTTWGQASWSETETNGSVSMQVYYDAGSGCNTIIPNTALTGNSTGFATSPINISGLNTTTYANICLKSTLIYSGGTPYLNDWTVSWFESLLVSTTTSISPNSKTVGDLAFILTVDGANFITGSVVIFNGSSRTTNYISTTQLDANILASDITSAGSFLVLVNSPSGGGDSNSQIFTVHNVIPNITSIIPTSVPIGSSQFTMTINGVNFVSNSQVKFGGSSRTTTFISSTQLSAVILASDLVSAGTFSITVYNGTTGETSAAQQFTVGPLGRREFNYSRTFYGSASLRK